MSASASASTGMSASGSASESETFRKEFNEYNDIHEGLNGHLLEYTSSHEALGVEIAAVTALPSDKIIPAVKKKEALDKLKLRLDELVNEYNTIILHTDENNVKLKELKVRIQDAITAKQLAAAAAAAKAAQDASTAAQALAAAKDAIQTQINALNELIKTRNTAFDDIVTLKSNEVNHIINIVIPTNLEDIKQRIKAEHISQTTRDMVEGIETSIKKSIRDEFQSISTQSDAKHKNEIEAINAQINKWTYVKNGNDIETMLSANASIVTPSSSTILEDFRIAVDKLVNTELEKLDNAKADVEAAIAVDQDKDIAVKSDITVLLEDVNKLNVSVEPVVGKLAKAAQVEVTSPSLKANLGAILGNANTTLQPFGRAVETINSRFEQMNKTMNESYKSSGNYLTLKETIDGLNKLYTAQQNKYDELNVKYTNYATPPPDTRLSSAAPRRPASAHAAASATTTTSQRRSTSADAAAAAAARPRLAFTNAQFKPIPYRPSQDEEEDYLIEADVKSKPVTPPPPIIGGARRNFLYVSHNTEPKTAYLVVVKKPPVDESQGGGGGNKNYHVQKGGAPPPFQLPEGSEIFPIDTDNLKFLDIMVSFIPPSDLLTVNPDGTGENPIITEIRSGRRQTVNLNALYKKIKSKLITDENQNPLTIGLRAVYYPNVIKLVRLLDFNLGHGEMSYKEMFEKLRKFMDFTDGTFGVLDALYKDTFHQGSLAPPPLPPYSPQGSPPSSPRLSPRKPPKKIDSVLKKQSKDAKKAIKTIVGWTSSTENTNFNMLTKMFSKDCTHTGLPNKPNTFLNDDKKLGSNPTSYHKFRLNWIILLAFHSYYNKQSTLETVGKLIASLYNAFLGWLATLSYKDTFMRLFNGTLHDPTINYSEIFNNQLNASLNSENSSYKDVYTLVQNINDKMCELQEDRNPAIDVVHDDEYHDDENDPDYMPDENESDDDSVRSDDVREAGKDLEVLSPPGFSPRPDGARTRGDRRNPKFPGRTSVKLSSPPGDPDPDSPFNSEVEEHAEPPKVPPLTYPIGQSLGGPLSERTGDKERQRAMLNRLVNDMGVRGVGSVTDRPLQRQPLRPGAVSPFHKDANLDVEMRPGALPKAVQQQHGSQPTVITTGPRTTGPRKKLSVGVGSSYKPPAAPASTPAPFVPASTPAPFVPAPPQQPPGKGTPGRRTSLTNRLLTGTGTRGERGGNNKKRTRKHKKHTSISASRRPTRRRRIPPTEGHKYTRKRPRT